MLFKIAQARIFQTPAKPTFHAAANALTFSLSKGADARVGILQRLLGNYRGDILSKLLHGSGVDTVTDSVDYWVLGLTFGVYPLSEKGTADHSIDTIPEGIARYQQFAIGRSR